MILTTTAIMRCFLFFEETDIDRMINVLNWAKNGCVGNGGEKASEFKI